MIVVEGGTGPSWIAFDCPCELRHRLLVPVSKRMSPNWKLTGLKRPSLYPSVDSIEQSRRCHFWLSEGKVRWARAHHKEQAL